MTASSAAAAGRPPDASDAGAIRARGDQLRELHPDWSDAQIRHQLQREKFTLPAIMRYLKGEDQPPEKPHPAAPATPPAPGRSSPGKSSGGSLYVSPGTPAGVLLALVAYPAGLAYLKGGKAGLRAWFRAKFLNQTDTDPGITAEQWQQLLTAPGAKLTGLVTPKRKGQGAVGGSSVAGAAAVAFARSQIGKPYRLGGTGPGSWDCSGLTQAAWRAAGVRIPRNTTLQLAMLPRGNRRDLQAGDLIFPEPTHVQMYAGGGRIIEAPRDGLKVREEPLGPVMAVRRPKVKGIQT